MKLDLGAVPESYMKRAPSGKQGTIREYAYPVNHYIDVKRQLVRDHPIKSENAGRPTVAGEAIIKYCHVYLPAGYDEQDQNTRYNVLYLLHGVGGDHSEWLRGSGNEGDHSILCHILDNLIANDDMDPILVVMPNGRSSHDWMNRAFTPEGTNMLGFYYFDYELRYDLIPFIEATFHTYANIKEADPEAVEYNRMHRAIAGLSMGGMQALNLILGGYRCDSAAVTETASEWDNGLVTTVRAPGMTDLFAYVGAFSNAPTSSRGKDLVEGIVTSGNRLRLMYLTCGDADTVSIACYSQSIEGLADLAGDYLDAFHTVIIKGGVHDFDVWNNGLFHFTRLVFANERIHSD